MSSNHSWIAFKNPTVQTPGAAEPCVRPSTPFLVKPKPFKLDLIYTRREG